VSSEAVRVIRDIPPGVSEQTLVELRSLVAYSLAVPSPSELREQRLGLLIEMIARAPARIPLGEAYENERAGRIASGEELPSALTLRSQLSRAYGSWLLAVSAAIELNRPSGDTPPPSYQARPVSGRRYTREDVILAIVRCQDEIGAWPTQSHYLQWRRILRHTGRLYGPGEPGCPTPRPYDAYSAAGLTPGTQHSDGRQRLQSSVAQAKRNQRTPIVIRRCLSKVRRCWSPSPSATTSHAPAIRRAIVSPSTPGPGRSQGVPVAAASPATMPASFRVGRRARRYRSTPARHAVPRTARAPGLLRPT
jgi:hypothetical protein